MEIDRQFPPVEIAENLMKTPKTIQETNAEVVRYSSPHSKRTEYADRRQQEMKRRFGVLQSRRGYLERELKAIKVGLFQLDQQMQSYSAYKQLSKRD